jgi:hypothetical protein
MTASCSDVPASLVSPADCLQHALVFPVGINPEIVVPFQAWWVHVVDEHWNEEHKVITESVGVTRCSGGKFPKRIDRFLWTSSAILTHRELEISPQSQIPLG